jgi:hypothetical protein
MIPISGCYGCSDNIVSPAVCVGVRWRSIIDILTSKSQLLVLSHTCSIDLMTEYTNSWIMILQPHR